MGRTKTARTNLARPPAARRRPGTELHRIPSRGKWAGDIEPLGLRERKKARLRQEIIDTAVRLFRKRGYEKTRIDSKDAVLGEVGRRGFACITEHLRNELSSEATTDEHLSRLYRELARRAEADRPLWQAVVLSGAMDPVRSPDMREHKEFALELLREILAQGQKRGEVSRALPVEHLAEFMDGLYNTTVRQWAVDLTGPHKLSDRVSSAVAFFLRGVRP